MTLTDADLARLEALDEGATAGPWTLATRGSSYAKCPQCDQGEYIARALPSTYGPENHNTEADAALITEFRNRTPDLVVDLRAKDAELREARAEIERLRAKLGRFEAMLPLDGSVYPLTTDDIRRVLADDTGKYVVVPVADLSIVPAEAELREARAALARVKALCEQAEHECDEPCEVINCDETRAYLVSKGRLRAAIGGCLR